MSTTCTIYPTVAAIKQAEKILGANRVWQTTNAMQERFLREFFVPCRDEVENIREIESLASFDYQEINVFLRQRGFTIQLDPFFPPDFGTGSVLDILVEWLCAGKRTTIEDAHRHTFPAARITQDNVRFYRVRDHPNPLAALETKSGDIVYMTMLDQAPDGFDLVVKAQEFSEQKRGTNEFGDLVFPMLSLDQEVDIKWLIGMLNAPTEQQSLLNMSALASGLPARVEQALQQTKLKMNEIGARVESAVAIRLRVLSAMPEPRPTHIINRPFLIWFKRVGLQIPLFVGHITPDDWHDPKTLEQESSETEIFELGQL